MYVYIICLCVYLRTYVYIYVCIYVYCTSVGLFAKCVTIVSPCNLGVIAQQDDLDTSFPNEKGLRYMYKHYSPVYVYTYISMSYVNAKDFYIINIISVYVCMQCFLYKCCSAFANALIQC